MAVMTQKQIEKLLQKKAKGFVTEMAKACEKLLKQNIRSELYGEDHTLTKNPTYRKIFRDRALIGAVLREPTSKEFDGWGTTIGFDIGYLESAAEPKGYNPGVGSYLGRYTDVHGNFVGDDMIADGWLEDGAGGIVPRSGAGFMQKTVDEMEDFIANIGAEAYFSNEFGSILITRGR